MTKEEYYATVYVKGIKVDIGMDDYGQCYFFEYVDEDGKLNSIGCGTYNFNYLNEIYYTLDPYNTEVSIFGKEDFIEQTKVLLERYNKDPIKDKYLEEWYQHTIKPRLDYIEAGNFVFYDFEAMYKEIEEQRKKAETE